MQRLTVAKFLFLFHENIAHFFGFHPSNSTPRVEPTTVLLTAAAAAAAVVPIIGKQFFPFRHAGSAAAQQLSQSPNGACRGKTAAAQSLNVPIANSSSSPI